MRSDNGLPSMCRVPLVTVALRVGAAAATGAAIDAARAASATPPSNVFLVISVSCLRFRFESAAANDRIGEDRAKAIRRHGRDRFHPVVGGTPADLLGQLQQRKDLAQEVLELFDILWIEPLQELAITDRDSGDRGVHDLAPLIGQLDDHSTAIVRVVQSTHESAALHSVDSARHARRRKHESLGEASRGKPIGRTRDPQGAQRTDLPAAQTETAEDFVLPPGEVWADPAEASRHLQRPHVEVGARFVPATQQSIRRVI